MKRQLTITIDYDDDCIKTLDPDYPLRHNGDIFLDHLKRLLALDDISESYYLKHQDEILCDNKNIKQRNYAFLKAFEKAMTRIHVSSSHVFEHYEFEDENEPIYSYETRVVLDCPMWKNNKLSEALCRAYTGKDTFPLDEQPSYDHHEAYVNFSRTHNIKVKVYCYKDGSIKCRILK